MVDKDYKEEAEHYYKSNPAKPLGQVQYEKSIGPEHPQSGAKVGRKELGPTRADLEAEERKRKKEKEAEFKRNFQIEKDANAARLKGEKRDAKQKAAPASKPHPSFGGMLAQKATAGIQSWWNAPAPKPAGRSKGRKPGKSTPAVRRSRELRAPGRSTGGFGFGGMELPGSSGGLLKGWGAPPKKKKGGGWGLL